MGGPPVKISDLSTFSPYIEDESARPKDPVSNQPYLCFNWKRAHDKPENIVQFTRWAEYTHASGASIYPSAGLVLPNTLLPHITRRCRQKYDYIKRKWIAFDKKKMGTPAPPSSAAPTPTATATEQQGADSNGDDPPAPAPPDSPEEVQATSQLRQTRAKGVS